MAANAVLIVDDDDDILLELEEFLTSLGVGCHCASGVDGALRMLEACDDICLILTDLRMPDKSGLRLIQTMNGRPAERRVPIIVTSGHADMSDVITLFRSGVVDFLPKPIYFDRLIELLARYVPGFHPSGVTP